MNPRDQGKLGEDDPTSEEEALEFDGTQTLQLDESYRMRLVLASESATGGVFHDDPGHVRCKWKTESVPSADPAAETFNYFKALDANLEIEPTQPVRTLEQPKLPGFDPYDAAPGKKPK